MYAILFALLIMVNFSMIMDVRLIIFTWPTMDVCLSASYIYNEWMP